MLLSGVSDLDEGKHDMTVNSCNHVERELQRMLQQRVVCSCSKSEERDELRVRHTQKRRALPRALPRAHRNKSVARGHFRATTPNSSGDSSNCTFHCRLQQQQSISTTHLTREKLCV